MIGHVYCPLVTHHDDSIYCISHSLQYTISGKKVEVAVKRIISGETVNQRGALSNPSSLDLYYNIPELEISGLSVSVNGHSH